MKFSELFRYASHRANTRILDTLEERNMSEFECAKGNIHGASEIKDGFCPCGERIVRMDGKTAKQLNAEEGYIPDDEMEDEEVETL